jgi:hypothetical protein
VNTTTTTATAVIAVPLQLTIMTSQAQTQFLAAKWLGWMLLLITHWHHLVVLRDHQEANNQQAGHMGPDVTLAQGESE